MKPRRSYLRCSICGTAGDVQPSSTLARQWGKAAGWSRCYNGAGEQFRCPECRRADLDADPHPIGDYDGPSTDNGSRTIIIRGELWHGLEHHAGKLGTTPRELALAILTKAVAP